MFIEFIFLKSFAKINIIYKCCNCFALNNVNNIKIVTNYKLFVGKNKRMRIFSV